MASYYTKENGKFQLRDCNDEGKTLVEMRHIAVVYDKSTSAIRTHGIPLAVEEYLAKQHFLGDTSLLMIKSARWNVDALNRILDCGNRSGQVMLGERLMDAAMGHDNDEDKFLVAEHENDAADAAVEAGENPAHSMVTR